MGFIFTILKTIRNLFPYFVLIAIYFFFVNLEAGKDKKDKQNNDKEYIIPKDRSDIDNQNLRIKIPVIPYSQ